MTSTDQEHSTVPNNSEHSIPLVLPESLLQKSQLIEDATEPEDCPEVKASNIPVQTVGTLVDTNNRTALSVPPNNETNLTSISSIADEPNVELLRSFQKNASANKETNRQSAITGSYCSNLI